MELQNYWLLLIWPLIYGALCLVVKTEKEEVVLGKRVIRWKPAAAFILTIPFVIWAGWRRWFGDTEQYRATFKSLPSAFNQIIPYMKGVEKGHGFRLFEMLFKCTISESDIFFFVVLALIQIICLVYVYRKYSPNYWLSFFFFIASTDYLSWMFNGIRQFLAVVIVFLTIPLIAKKRYIPAILLVLLAAAFHASALVFLPVIFIVNGKAWNYRTLLFIVAIILVVVFIDRVTGFMSAAMEDTAYEGDIMFLNRELDDGTNIFRVLFYSLPAVMSFIFRRYLNYADDPLINVCANLSIVTAGFYVFSYFSSGILMGAIPIFFSLANYILLPWLIINVFNEPSQRIMRLFFIGMYIFFFYYQCGPTWGLL